MKERKDKGTNTEIVLIIKELPEYPCIVQNLPEYPFVMQTFTARKGFSCKTFRANQCILVNIQTPKGIFEFFPKTNPLST